MDKLYFHSVKLNKDKCTGCTNCIKRCPTEAIRVRDGKARIINERCIDCGVCVRVCPHHAKEVVTDTIADIKKFKYSIALPAPALYGQFKGLRDIGLILGAIKKLGFDDVYETSIGADIVAKYISKAAKENKLKKPAISSACPAVARLIQVRFPDLTSHLVNIRPPFEIAAKLARESFCKKHGCLPEEVGVFFLSPCAAKMTSVNAPLGNTFSYVNGVISIIDIYGRLATLLSHPENIERIPPRSLSGGVGWAASGGEVNEAGIKNSIAVDGISNVIDVLNDIEDGRLYDLDFFEGLACAGGCVGGPLAYENGFVAKKRILSMVSKLAPEDAEKSKNLPVIEDESELYFTEEIQPNPVMKLDDDIKEAIKKLENIEKLNKELPGLDCGACGSPSCRCMAEDIVRGFADELDCIVNLKARVRVLAKGVVELAENIDEKSEE